MIFVHCRTAAEMLSRAYGPAFGASAVESVQGTPFRHIPATDERQANAALTPSLCW